MPPNPPLSSLPFFPPSLLYHEFKMWLNLHQSDWAALELYPRGTGWLLEECGLNHHLGSVVIFSEGLACGAFSKRSCCWHPGPHLGAIPMLGESQAGHDFSFQSAEIPLVLQARLPSAWYGWEVCGKQGGGYLSEKSSSCCLFLCKYQKLRICLTWSIVALLVNWLTAFSVQLQ